MRDWIIGISIEGIGLDPDESNGTIFGAHRDPGAVNWDFRDSLVTDVRSIATKVDPYQVDVRTSRFTFELHAHDPEAELFLGQGTEEEFALTGFVPRVSPTQRRFPVEGLNNPEQYEGSIVYIKDETVKLGIWNEAGQEFVSNDGGYHSSRKQAHSAGDKVFLRPPHWAYRRVVLYLWRGPSSVTDPFVEWSGYLKTGASTSSDGLRIVLDTEEVLSPIRRTETWKDRQTFAFPGDSNSGLARKEIRDQTPNIVGPNPQLISDIYKVQDHTEEYGRIMLFHVDDGLVFAEDTQFESAQARLGSKIDYEDEGSTEVPNVEDIEELHEVFVVSKELDEYAEERYGFPISPTRGHDYPYHPLTIVGALLFSSDRSTAVPERYDLLTANLSLNAGWAFSDDVFSALDELIENTSEIEVDHFMLGWEEDDTPLDVWKICTDLMKPWGFFWAPQQDGTYSFDRIRLFDIVDKAVADFAPTYFYPDQLEWIGASRSSQDGMSVRVGALPWNDRRDVTVSTVGTSARASQLANKREHHLDMSMIAASNADHFVDNFRDNAIMRFFGIPRVRLRLPDRELTGTDLSIGSVIRIEQTLLEDAWFVDNEGNRTKDLDDDQFLMQVIERRLLLDTQDFTYEITGLLSNYRVGQVTRWRGPCLAITGFETGDWVATFSGSLFGFPESDAQSFEQGDQVVACTRSGAVHPSGTVTVLDVDGNMVQLSTSIPDAEIGDYLRLDVSSNYENTNVIQGPFQEDVTQPYAFLGDENEEIERPDNETDDADIYA